MSNIVQFQTETIINRNGNVMWRPAPLLSDDELFDECRSIREEMRRRNKASEASAIH